VKPVSVVAFNSSPHAPEGATATILDPFLDGMRQAGAEVELLFPHRLDIKPCLGCLACWTKTPGRCAQEDDMRGVLAALARADVVVYGTPLYVDGMNAQLKVVLDRSIPLLRPFFVERDGHCRHDLREGCAGGRVALVSVSGFTELDNFDPLVAHVRAASANMGREFAGALLRPYANSLGELAQAGIPVADVYDACRAAGGQLVRDGRMSPDTLARVSRELVPRDRYIKAVNVHFRQALTRRGIAPEDRDRFPEHQPPGRQADTGQ
jgi:multimeric flavodoxin WrbA